MSTTLLSLQKSRVCLHRLAARGFSTRASPLLTRYTLPDPYSTRIPTVDLAYEKFASASSKKVAQLKEAGEPIPQELQNSLDQKKESIIFLHGLFGSKINTRTVSKALSRDLDRDVYGLDLRNHGDSPHNPIHTYPALAADVEHFMAKHNIGPSIIVGHSMGAKTAMAMALRPNSKETVAALVSVDNSPWNAQLSSQFPKYVRALVEIENSHFTKSSDMYKVLSKVEPDLVVQQFLVSNIKRWPNLPESARKELAIKLLNKKPSPAGNHPHEHHPHRDRSGAVKDHHTGAFSDIKAAEEYLASDKHKNVLHSRVPLDIIGKSLDNLADFQYLPSETRYSGPTLFVRGMKSH